MFQYKPRPNLRRSLTKRNKPCAIGSLDNDEGDLILHIGDELCSKRQMM